MSLSILLDYDNLNYLDKSRDLLYLADKLIRKLDFQEVGERSIQIRLYGGWYENNSITKKAQILRTEIIRNFPATNTFSDNKTTVRVNIELALSLYAVPQVDFFNTYRRRGNPSGIACEDPRALGCTQSICPIVNVYDFFTNNRCIKCNNVKTDDIIFRQEQKLIDTMLTTDLIDIAVANKKVCLASSDDDMWPGIYYSISKGAKIFHILTKTTSPPPHYLKTVKSNYISKSLLI